MKRYLTMMDIIGSEDHPANRMYHGVLAVGFLGALIARFRPRGMALALVATDGRAAREIAAETVAAFWQALGSEVTLYFADSSDLSSTSSWDFGDLSPGSVETNPTHTFTCASLCEYTVVLTATNAYGSSTATSST